jgi:hemerythrin-like domain-containing protein
MKRSPHLRSLSVEHQSALSLAARIERAARSSATSDLRAWETEIERYSRSELLPHFTVEERIWLPALASAGLVSYTQRTFGEHRELAALATDRSMPLRERLTRFASLLQAHVRFEERELFEAAQRALTDSELEALARATSG